MIKKLLISMMITFSLVGLATLTTPTAHAGAPAAAPKTCGDTTRFLTFPAWYRGLTTGTGDQCQITSPGSGTNGVRNFVLKIILNVLEIMIQLVAYIAAAYVIYGGFNYFRVASSSDAVAKARKTIQNALIGLVISLVAVTIISFVVAQLGAPRP